MRRMDEIAAKRVLLDVELIALIALVLGVVGHALARRFAMRSDPVPASRDFDGFDLLLMFFPAMLFLLNPVLDVIPQTRDAGPAPVDADGAPDGAGLFSLFVNLGYFGFIGLMTYGIIEWVRNRRVVRLFGLARRSLPVIVVATILGGALSMVVCAWGLGNVSQVFLHGMFGELEMQEPVRKLRESDSAMQLTSAILLACVAAPLVEEFLFRGYMYGALKRATSPVFAAVVIGALFAVVHGNLPALIPLWGFSLLLCAAYEWSGCLWVPVGMHAFFNGANILLMVVPAPIQ